jgi:septal ring factor EnvC (AmiA/AmiB activator)
MGSIERFISTLPSTGHDDFVAILQAMSDGLYLSRIREIDAELAKLIVRIDEINDRRSKLSAQRALVERAMKRLEEYMRNDGADLEMQLFHMHLSNHLDRLKVRIADTRPDDDLKRKHDLTRERMLIDAGKKIAIEILGTVAKVDVKSA